MLLMGVVLPKHEKIAVDTDEILVAKNRFAEGVNVVMNSGYSHACFKYSAVLHQMNGFCTSKSEFNINVAGGSKVKAKGEWMVSLKKRNGDYQAVIGLALDCVTE